MQSKCGLLCAKRNVTFIGEMANIKGKYFNMKGLLDHAQQRMQKMNERLWPLFDGNGNAASEDELSLPCK
jgi:hypothetical protein